MLTPEILTHTARLAGLSISELDADKMQAELTQILDWVRVLQEIDTQEVEPLIYPIEVLNAWVEDEPKLAYTQAEALQNAPKHNETSFLVAKVL